MSKSKRSIEETEANTHKKGKDETFKKIQCYISDTMPRCNLVSNANRMFESRSACMYHFLTEFLGEKRFLSEYMTIPILASLSDMPIESYKLLCKNIITNIFNTYDNSDGMLKKSAHRMLLGIQNNIKTTDKNYGIVDEFYNLMFRLLECNNSWNDSMNKNYLSSIKTSLMLSNIVENESHHRNMLLNIKFYREILGVMNEESYVLRSEWNPVLSDTLPAQYTEDYIEPKWVDECSKRSIDDCGKTLVDKDPLSSCKVRKGRCISSSLYKNPAKDGYEIDSRYIFRPLCLYKIIVGNCGIYRRYDNPDLLTNETMIYHETNKYTIVFPPFDFKGKTASEKTCEVIASFNVFYQNSYIKDIKFGGITVGVHAGFYSWIESWYKQCNISTLIKNKAAEISIVGVSLGGALANVATFYLLTKAYTNIHMYAYGAPRVGDTRFSEFISNNENIVSDSANFVRFNNVVDMKTFYTQCDPVCKMPPSQFNYLYNLSFSDNPRIKIMAGSLLFNDVFNMLGSQPDYNMSAPFSTLSKKTKLTNRCAKYWPQVHSVDSYGYDVLTGELKYWNDLDGYEGYLEGIKMTKDCPEPSGLTCKLINLPIIGGIVNMIGAGAVVGSAAAPVLLSM